jgi:single-strand DNA-binding protein
MASYNKVILMGNLTRDPELRYTQGANSTAVCKVGLAVNRRYKNQQGEWVEKPTFVDVTIFGNRGEAFEKFHRKGATAFIEGRLELDTWEDKNSGQKRSKLYVIAENWEFAGGGRGEGGGGGGGGRRDSGQDGGWGSQGGGSQSGGSRDGDGGYGEYGAQPAGDSFEDTPF